MDTTKRLLSVLKDEEQATVGQKSQSEKVLLLLVDLRIRY